MKSNYIVIKLDTPTLKGSRPMSFVGYYQPSRVESNSVMYRVSNIKFPKELVTPIVLTLKKEEGMVYEK